MTDYRDDSIATDETQRLIASNKVEGTAVYGMDGEKLGHVYNFMVDKRSGQVEYAVLGFGGLFGMGENYHPLPWNTLTYDTDKGGYVVNIAKDRLQGGPSYKAGEEPSFDRDYDRRVIDYYGVTATY
ncbi:MAG: PRC-barrel domain-containing protein [Proteobacteria bacterium]|nr:PRC-barrel domain-containing protein [Pseudomonadota bacterium]